MNDLLVIMGASEERGTMREYLRQLDDAGIQHHEYKIDEEWMKANTIGAALEKVQDIAIRFGDYDNLIFSDAWDVLFYGTKSEVVRKIPKDHVLLAAERNCYPDSSLASNFPGATAWKFVNGGLMAGRPNIIYDWVESIKKSPSYNPNFLNQGFFNILRFNGSPLVPLDDRTELFYCLYNEQEELQFEKGLPVNTVLGTHPNFIHANGQWPTESILHRRRQSLNPVQTAVPDKNMLSSVGLIIGLPFCGRPVAPAWAICLATQNYPLNTNRVIHATNGEEIGKARNKIVEGALKAKAKYLFFIDDDVSIPAFASKALITTLENSDDKTMVCGGIYCSKALPTEPVVFREEGRGPFWRWKVGDVFECSSIGTGCMMIKMEVFEHLERPWFKTVDEMETVSTPLIQMTDDMYFCQKVRQAGFKILADTNVLTTHWEWNGEKREFNNYFLPEDCYPIRPVSAVEPRCRREM